MKQNDQKGRIRQVLLNMKAAADRGNAYSMGAHPDNPGAFARWMTKTDEMLMGAARFDVEGFLANLDLPESPGITASDFDQWIEDHVLNPLSDDDDISVCPEAHLAELIKRAGGRLLT